ncbi:alpha/beta hydrolase [Paraclostridium tenue]
MRIYAKKLTELGYVTIVFDASYQGESEGEPRYIEEPAARVEDICSAVDYLTTLDFVDENRIGVLGVCAGGGYVVNVAMTEKT